MKSPYPDNAWTKLDDVEGAGWSREGLQQVRQAATEFDSAAVMVVHKGQLVLDWGQTDRKLNCHSMRKSLLSALIGVYVDRGVIDLTSTLAELGIDETTPLTDAEKQATVRDLLCSRSGIYLPAHYEGGGGKPERGSHSPGEHWLYNNWDFNALGTVFEKSTGTGIAEAFKDCIADPTQMQDFEVGDLTYVGGPESDHPAYPFRMTARDLARFGLLFLREGCWNGSRLISQSWVSESTASHSTQIRATSPGLGYGYMWWTAQGRDAWPGVAFEGSSYAALGVGGHGVFVLPHADLVIVHRVDTDNVSNVLDMEIGCLLRLILSAGGMGDANDAPGLDGLASLEAVPLPHDLQVRAPGKSVDPAIAALSGQWAGTWRSGAVHLLVVEEISPDACTVVCAWLELGADGSSEWRRSRGRIADCQLSVTLDFDVTLSYRLLPDGNLAVAARSSFPDADTVLRRIDLAPGAGSANSLELVK